MIYKAVLNITSAQLLSLDSVPVIIVPAPGAGFYICVLNFSFEYVFKTTPYTPASSTDAIGLGTDTVDGYFQSAVLQQGFIDQSASQISAFGNLDQNVTSGNPVPLTEANNKPLLVGATTAPTVGDGTINVIVYYTIEPVL
jgi:hypothetical protein